MIKTLVIKVDPDKPDRGSIAKAAEVIKNGGLAAFPTETVYGLGANALDEKAVERLYEVKARPRNKPFTVQIAEVKAIKDVSGCELTEEATKLADKFWPGPLTIILKSARGENVGFRMPRNNIALSLIRTVGIPLCVPSANTSGNPAPTTAAGVLKELSGRIDLVIDGGPTEIGVESTVIDMTVAPPKILREGAIKKDEIFKELKK